VNTPPRSIHVGVNGRTFVEDEPGGAVQTAKELTRGLIGTDGVDVTIFGHESLETEFDAPVRSDLYQSFSPYYGVVWERTALPALAQRCEIDVLFCPNGNGPLHRTSFPVVTCIHDVSAQDDWSATMHGLYRKVTIPRVARVSDHLVTVSKFSKSEITSKFDVDPSRITVIHNGISEWFLSDKPGTPVDVPEKYILYVGALNPRKNVNGLVRAYRRVSDKLKHDLVLTGPRNKEIFKSLEIIEADDIHLTGFVSQDELKFLYNQADVFAYPSFYEGFGLPPLEAAACGTPVVASRTGAIPDILGDAARYVDPRDVTDIGSGLQWAASDPAVEKHATAAQERVQPVTWECATEELCSTLTNIVDLTND
jgi:glycosyltransferase involved in cell wall biosynthesis